MYIMRKMNREKKASTDAERASLLADGYKDITPDTQHENVPVKKENPVIREPVKKVKESAGKSAVIIREPVKKTKEAVKKTETEQQNPVEEAEPMKQEPAAVTESERQNPVEEADTKVQGSVEPEKEG